MILSFGLYNNLIGVKNNLKCINVKMLHKNLHSRLYEETYLEIR